MTEVSGNPAAAEAAVSLSGVTKKYGGVTALNNVSLDIRDNEFFTLLGPSGCGKTTMLRTIAGFEDISEGDIRLYGRSIVRLPPHKRPVNTVFQQYALFPHMTVTDNVMFGLLRLRASEDEAAARAREVLDMVRLSEFAGRFPSQLSGGQQQRVALARALAPRPKVLLLDEPLSALDLKLRQDVRVELQQIQHSTGITFIFVTHDQEEAITMSDRIAVLSAGEIQQTGAPEEIYESPKNMFVADFIGETNFIGVEVTAVENGAGSAVLPGGRTFTCRAAEGASAGRGHVSVRPERLKLVKPGEGHLDGVVSRHTYLGVGVHVQVALAGGEVMTARVQHTGDGAPGPGARVGLELEAGAARLLAD